MRPWPWIGLFGLILIPACARQAPLPLPDSTADLPKSWTATQVTPGTVDPQWWRSFDDPKLESLIFEAWEGNPSLQIAAARVAAASAEAEMAGAPRYPSLGLSYSARRQRQNFIGLPIPGAEGRVLSTTFTNMGVSLDTSWEADLWGRLSEGEAAALAQAQAVESDYHAARQSLAGQTARLWFALNESHSQLELAQEVAESHQRTVDVVNRRFENGLRTALDLHLAEAARAAAAASLQQRKEIYKRLVVQFETLLGRYPEGDMAPTGTLPSTPPQPPAGLPAETVARRPDLRAAERRLLASQSISRQSRSAFYPSLSLTTSGGTATRALRDLLNGDFGVWSLAAGIFQPVFQGGRLRAQAERDEHRLREAYASYAAAILQALAEVESALAAEEALTVLEMELSRSVQEARKAQGIAEERFRQGLLDLIVVLESHRRVMESESQWLAARRQRLDARVDLHLALGGGF